VILQAKAFKVTAVLESAAVAGLNVPGNQPKMSLRISVSGRTLRTELVCKSLRKVQAQISEHSPDAVAVVLQGKLEGESLLEAGITAQIKTPKPATA
jgi:hypothetical protein